MKQSHSLTLVFWTLFMAILFSAVLSGSSINPARDGYMAYIGAYTGAKSKGIYVCRYDAATGKLSSPELAAETANPSYMVIHPNHRFLYAVGEVSQYDSRKSGFVGAFAIDPSTGKLSLLNRVASGGGGPCHLVLDKSGKNLLVANYGGGSVAVLPVKDDGSLSEASAFVQHTGSSVNPRRQAGPHAHCVVLSPDNRFAFVVDLGLDKVMIYRFDARRGSLTANDPPFAELSPGAGPRHMVFGSQGRFAYVINELNSTVTQFAFDRARGALKMVQSVTTLPAGFSGQNSGAEIQLAPSGKFLYGSNRGDNSIAVFAVESKTGVLRTVGQVSTQGKTPRYFTLDPVGNYLLAANQDSGDIVVFHIDSKTGGLVPAGQRVEILAPVCIQFLKTNS